MPRNRLGCFTLSGILAALITGFVIAGVAFARGGTLYSPGPLNAQAGETLGGVTSHAEIGGQCEACHSAPWSSVRMADLCVNCHGEIAQQMQNMVALHGAMYQKDPKLECRNCHSEHGGPDAPLTVMQGGAFPHELLGFSLNGHRLTAQKVPFTCADCHQADLSTFATDSCDACHRQMDAGFTQAHVQAYGTACLNCHDGVDRFGKQFSHNSFQFKLTGKHVDVACAECHVDARSLTDFPTAPQDCYTCHRADDPHETRFGTDCGACHSPDGWKPAKFDHNLSAFKLEGAHAEVACESCHRNGVFKGTPTDCYACHQQDDAHSGNFGKDCSTCHVPVSWDSVTFDHNRTAFPLDGAHANVQCGQCHTNNTFVGTPTQCVACHADPDFHAGAFGTSCADCHSTTAWSPARFNLSHPEPRVEEGGSGINHGGTTCRTCHPDSIRSYTCLACHRDNQGGEGGGDD